MNTFQATLRHKLKSIDAKALVAQRLKRTPSIVNKLRRFDTMKLARMQDIGGLRAVVTTISKLRALEDAYTARSRFDHELTNTKNYVEQPKPDGYRSIHLVYRYKNKNAAAYNGLLLELQLRTKLQHAWATAVETMGTFLGQALKSKEGDHDWLEFFAVAGAAFAHLERCPPIPGYEELSRRETFERVAAAESELSVLDKLKGFAVAAQAITRKKSGAFHLVVLHSQNKTVTVEGFPRRDLQEAVNRYAVWEARQRGGERVEAVLVSAGPVESLRNAYPNYFLDAADFVKRVQRIIRTVRNGTTVRPTTARLRRNRRG